MSEVSRRPFLVGAQLALEPLDLHHLHGPYLSWLNDAEVCRFNSHHRVPYNSVAATAYLHRVIERGDIVLAITTAKDNRHIGNVSLQGMDWFHRSAELAIVLGEPSAWGRGYATEAGHLLLGHAFGALNLRRITAGTLASNVAMRALAERLGMTQEGTRRQALYKDGQWCDVIEYGLLASDYEEDRTRD